MNFTVSENKKRVPEITGILKGLYPDAGIALVFKGMWQLYVSVVLSAQCTDVRVNKVTSPLFDRLPTVKNFAECDIGELEKMIYSTGFYKNKAKNIKSAAIKILTDFGGKVPDTMEDLLTVPGVARKTANVILSSGYGKNQGIVVDTHVIRISGLLELVPAKLSKTKNAVKIEQLLMKIVPKKDWGLFSHLIVTHGRQICIARRPKCKECKLNAICPSAIL